MPLLRLLVLLFMLGVTPLTEVVEEPVLVVGVLGKDVPLVLLGKEAALLLAFVVPFPVLFNESAVRLRSSSVADVSKSSSSDALESGPKYFSRAFKYFCSRTLISSRAGGALFGVVVPELAGDRVRFVESEVPALAEEMDEGEDVRFVGVFVPVLFGFLLSILTCGLYV